MTINIKDLTYRYAKEDPVLHIKQWQVDSGERLFLHGPSGCGKSTLLNILAGMLAVNEGHVSVCGQQLQRLNRYRRDQFRANHIGYVFQQFNLIPYLSAVDNIQLSCSFAKQATPSLEAIKELLARLNIAPTDWQKPTSSLSIGQQQRIAIARALINQPELLIADEPTSSLDAKNRDNFMSILMEITQESATTLIFVSHDQTLAKYFERCDHFETLNQLANTNHHL